MKQHLISTVVLLALAGCDVPPAQQSAPPEDVAVETATTEDGQARPQSRPDTLDTTPAAPPPPPQARTVEQFDTTTEEQRTEAVAEAAPEGGEVALGKTIATLGSPTEAGFWLKTPLVSKPAKGKVTFPGTGKSVAVDLIPIDGPKTAGSRMSLAAMRLIDAPLTGLPEVQVFRING